MGIPRIDSGPMTIPDFYAFTDSRPDEERWELIEGELVMNASPSKLHQIISLNVAFLLRRALATGDAFEVLQTIGLRLSETSRPEPDLIVRPKTDVRTDGGLRDFDDAVAIFEILSPSTANRDLRWKRKAYAALPSVSAYVVIAQDAVEAVIYERRTGFSEHRLETLGAAIELSDLGISLPLAEIYRDTGLDRT